ncbi:hypothetical protein PRIPAC_94676 [Pristionchus pacificus]|uniref:Uncharacterized protein n=1 Tax=Pristionchus pacificus TaxID=54126 RepID=A0A2A6BP31_PRIPA|nr:hypothetical protein PRIPAC_94676 [Pristionchus pacificus]|eukprot:PDM67712.1 hypothetical protein PRIPAC_45756 [Pristionchus pacificus]
MSTTRDMSMIVSFYLSRMSKPEKFEKCLASLSDMDLSAEVIRATRADKVISRYFDHSTGGKLARETVEKWRRDSVPVAKNLDMIKKTAASSDNTERSFHDGYVKKCVATLDRTKRPFDGAKNIAVSTKTSETMDNTKRQTLSPEWGRILAQIQYESISTDKKAANQKVAAEAPAMKIEENRKMEIATSKECAHTTTNPIEKSMERQSSLSTSLTVSSLIRPNEPKTRFNVDAIRARAAKRSTTINVDESRLKEIAVRIAKRKTVIIGKSSDRPLSIPSNLRVIGHNARPMIANTRR